LNADEIIEFKEIVKSNLNGTLPVCITFGDGIYDVNIVKPGRGSVTLNAKNNRIASFQADRIQFQYIPAVRTARTAAAVVEDIVANELRDLENDPAFQEALTAIRTLQRPVLNAFSERVTETLKAFVPGIRAVNFSVNDEDKFGVNLDLHPPRNRKAKWSARMGDSFAQAGRPFDDNTKARVKYAVADAVAGSPRNAIAAHAKGLILSLVENLERKLRPFDDADRRPEFLGAVTTKLEAAGPAVIGPGALHRTARTVLRDFWNPPPDLRQGRVGPRGELTSA
jgi:hypothetical protein